HYLEEAEMLCRNIGIIQSGQLTENTSMKNLLSKLKTETFVLDLEPTDKAFTLEGYPYIIEDKQTLEVVVERSQGLNGIFAQLEKQDIHVISMRNKANRLEELFVKLTHKD
ncbi:MAG: ABC transporter ATP-binding protein, partial [Streptococcaceae bacterium]|nr:ABC transporter ATP-binding protein [Streptococcaceae bacterium]